MTDDVRRLAAYVIAAKLPQLVTAEGDDDARDINEQAAWELIDALEAADLTITPATTGEPT